MRLVADTNVVVSGLLWLGNSGRLLEAAANGQVTLYTSPMLIAELTRILRTPKLMPRIERSGLTLEELLTRYLNVAIVVQPETVPTIVLTDPDDDQVLACALEADAEIVVSGDRDLLSLKTFRDIPIVTPAEAVNRIAQLSRG